jgi:hypothetical protein
MTFWYERVAGCPLDHSQEDPSEYLIHGDGGKPDWVRAPASTGHGGVYRCVELRPRRCPLPGHDHDCVDYVLDGPVGVLECPSGMFLWYLRRPQ